jgi:hypothetical protein
MILGRFLKTYLFLWFVSVALVPLTAIGQSVPTEDQSTATTQPTPPTAPQKWQKQKKKKPTILQSWQKVVTGDWASLNKHDNRNLTMSAVTLGAVYTFYYYCLRSAPVVNQQNNGQRNPQQRPENPGDIPDAELTPAQQAVIDLETRINAVPKNSLPCIGQAGLTCGNHAFMNTKAMLQHLEADPTIQPDALGAILAHRTRPVFIQNEIAQHDRITNERREPELWKAYITRQLTASLERKQSTWQWLTALFGFEYGFSRAELTARDNIAALLHDITYVQKQPVNFCVAGAQAPTNMSIKTTISNLIDNTNAIRGIDADHATNEERATNTAHAKEQCKQLLDHINLNVWQRNMGARLQASPEMLNHAKQTMPRGRDLDSAEIGSLIGKDKFTAEFMLKIKRDAEGKPITHDVDNQVPHFIDAYDKPTNINHKILIIEDSAQLLIKGTTLFNGLKAVKKACSEQENFCFGFILRLGARSHDYMKLKTIEPTTPLEDRYTIIEPIVTQDARYSMSHWISVVLHRANGQNHYYVTDSMDATGTTDPNNRLDVRILIEALETDNSY